MDELSIGYSLSARALEYVNSERINGVCRLRSLTCEREQLSELLVSHGIEPTARALEFEENLGGWGYVGPGSEHCLGIYCSLGAFDSTTSVAKDFRRMTWLFQRTRDQPGEEGELSPIWGTGYPRLFFRERPLIPAGMRGSELLYFVGPAGEMYLYQRETDVLYLVAGHGRTMIEREALAATVPDSEEWYRVHVCADAGDFASQYLALSEMAECSDDLFRVWAGKDACVVSTPDCPPSIGGTAVATRHPHTLLELLDAFRSSIPSRTVTCWERANNLRDAKGLALLEGSDGNVRVLSGAAPGHFDRVVDADTGEVTYVASQYRGLPSLDAAVR